MYLKLQKANKLNFDYLKHHLNDESLTMDSCTNKLVIYKGHDKIGVLDIEITNRICSINKLIFEPDYEEYRTNIAFWRILHDYCYDKGDEIIISFNLNQISSIDFFLKVGFQTIDKSFDNTTLKYTLNDWFCVEVLDELTYRISENKHPNQTHAYLVLGSKKALLIDTGMGVENIKPIIDKLTFFPLTVCLTSANWDCIGSIESFDKVFLGEEENDWLNIYPYNCQVIQGKIADNPTLLPKGYRVDEYHIPRKYDAANLKDGKTFNLGDRKITAISTPGTSKGHYCFVDSNGYLFSGSLICRGTIDLSTHFSSPGEFENSIKKLESFSFSSIQPGHGELIADLSFIDELKQAIKELESKKLFQAHSGFHHFKDFDIKL